VPAVRSVLVIGGGAAGTTAAILLADAGVGVDLVEAKPDPTAVGSGITLQGNALRVLRQAGVWERVAAAGYPFDSLGIRAPDPAGTLVAEFPDVRTGGPDLPATVATTWSSAPTGCARGPAARSASSWRPGRSAWGSGGRSGRARRA
jgi:2-polyprenyl-6-methoxyphenol hydroxylase-like FAD-dependent oxidoreductase